MRPRSPSRLSPWTSARVWRRSTSRDATPSVTFVGDSWTAGERRHRRARVRRPHRRGARLGLRGARRRRQRLHRGAAAGPPSASASTAPSRRDADVVVVQGSLNERQRRAGRAGGRGARHPLPAELRGGPGHAVLVVGASLHAGDPGRDHRVDQRRRSVRPPTGSVCCSSTRRRRTGPTRPTRRSGPTPTTPTTRGTSSSPTGWPSGWRRCSRAEGTVVVGPLRGDRLPSAVCPRGNTPRSSPPTTPSRSGPE